MLGTRSVTFDPLPSTPSATRGPIPASAGIGLRSQHLLDILAASPDVGWLEIHSENFLSDGGPHLHALEQIRQDFSISCHSVGLSLGSADGVDRTHIERLRRLYDRIEPGLISDHLSWSVAEGTYLNDLLPLPYTDEALAVVCSNVNRVQDMLGRQLLIENPSSYMSFAASNISEAEFLVEIATRTGCALLLDVNNIYVSAANLGFDAVHYVDLIAGAPIHEIHLAGHTQREIEGATILIDDHGARVSDPVWRLYDYTIARVGACPTLIEWDTDLPPLATLVDEAHQADSRHARLLQQPRSDAAHNHTALTAI